MNKSFPDESHRNTLVVLGLAAAWAGWTLWRRRRRVDWPEVTQALEGDRRPEAVLPAVLRGATRQAVFGLLGPPTASARDGSAVRPPSARQLGIDDWWYYPLSKNARRTLALGFVRGRVRELNVVDEPAQPPAASPD
ncbi:MAG: hypothetical protein ACFCVE_02415 [Phycisphaerae bacterium]